MKHTKFRLVFLSVLLLFSWCSSPLPAQEMPPLTALKQSLLKARDLSLSLEMTIKSLQVDNNKLQTTLQIQSTELNNLRTETMNLRTLSSEQEKTLHEQSRTLNHLHSLSNELLIQSSNLSREIRVYRAVIIIGVPLAFILGLLL